MGQEMLNALLFPLLFSIVGGTYAYLRFPDRRPKVLLTLVLFQLVGAYGHASQPDTGLFGLLTLHLLVVVTWLAHYLQTPQGRLRPERVRGE
ncbi:hypothetical protein [Deinococcus sp. NW-56]|uniref:hypothetical protein n=1 Tax=Deinococcus sp. NW-56 TaxID=2080419 RepID=UPI000CF544A1|nr:hypothetical protein [Deinococcus sp. NW-56]